MNARSAVSHPGPWMPRTLLPLPAIRHGSRNAIQPRSAATRTYFRWVWSVGGIFATTPSIDRSTGRIFSESFGFGGAGASAAAGGADSAAGTGAGGVLSAGEMI